MVWQWTTQYPSDLCYDNPKFNSFAFTKHQREKQVKIGWSQKHSEFFEVHIVIKQSIQMALVLLQVVVAIELNPQHPWGVNVEHHWFRHNKSSNFDTPFLAGHLFCSVDTRYIECECISLDNELVPHSLFYKQEHRPIVTNSFCLDSNPLSRMSDERDLQNPTTRVWCQQCSGNNCYLSVAIV